MTEPLIDTRRMANMKFKIKVRTGDGEEWWEDYDEDISDPQEWAKNTINRFNATLQPREEPRTLIDVEILDESNEKHHRWVKRTDGMSVNFQGSVVDIMSCQRYGITGKRYGFGRFGGRRYAEGLDPKRRK